MQLLAAYNSTPVDGFTFSRAKAMPCWLQMKQLMAQRFAPCLILACTRSSARTSQGGIYAVWLIASGCPTESCDESGYEPGFKVQL